MCSIKMFQMVSNAICVGVTARNVEPLVLRGGGTVLYRGMMLEGRMCSGL